MAIHATVVARHTPRGWRAVLLRGPSGSGKSDTALRLIEAGWRLVADDYAEVWASGGDLFATAPPRLAGRIEARGVGLVERPAIAVARVALIVDCRSERPERLPHPEHDVIAGVLLPRLSLDVREASAPVKVASALQTTLGGGALGA